MMASHLHIQDPYQWATLSTPLSRNGMPGRYVAGEVFSHQANTKKRKRSEISIAIDGDAVNLYDVTSSQLITSYPVPPRQHFTCSPCCVRWKSLGSKSAVRSTYVATEETQPFEYRITVFKDVVRGQGKTTSTSTTKVLSGTYSVVFLTTTSAANLMTRPNSAESIGVDLLCVADDGSIRCLDGETLAEIWHAPSVVFSQHILSGTQTQSQVHFVQSANAADIFGGFLDDGFQRIAAFPQRITANGFNPQVLLMVTSLETTASVTVDRHLHILAIHSPEARNLQGGSGAYHISTLMLPSPSVAVGGSTTYQIDIPSGTLMELSDGQLITYRFRDGIPSLLGARDLEGITSILRISKSLTLMSSPTHLRVYNTAYHSTLAASKIDSDGREAPAIDLISYFRKLRTAIAIRGNGLYTIQLEPPIGRKRKRWAEGLLIDSIGQGPVTEKKWQRVAIPSELPSAFSNYIPGSLSEAYYNDWNRGTSRAQQLLTEGDICGLERLMAKKFGLKVRESSNDTTYLKVSEASEAADGKESPSTTTKTLEWQWPKNWSFPPVDRRWILYSIAVVFHCETRSNQEDKSVLTLQQYDESPTNILNYLIIAGHLTVSNFESVFRKDMSSIDDSANLLGQHIPRVLADVDPNLDLLRNYLETTTLGAVELLSSIRIILHSLDLVRDTNNGLQVLRLLPAQDTTDMQQNYEHGIEGMDDDSVFGMDLDRLEEDLEMTESYLQRDDDVRAIALEIALRRLGNCPVSISVASIRMLLDQEEIFSLIHVLRVELVKGGWTARYLDNSYLEDEVTLIENIEVRQDGDTPARVGTDGSIPLIADLLCRCLDALGPDCWIINDKGSARSLGVVNGVASPESDDPARDSADFLASLRLEVSAALEGIQEAQYLRGILTEMVKYGRGSKDHKSLPACRELPFGLLGSVEGKVSKNKVISGGEIVQRSRREMGHLLSQKIGLYSHEKVHLW